MFVHTNIKMKKLLLAAFLLTAGMITSQTVIAQDLVFPESAKVVPTAPKAILDAFASKKIEAEAIDGVEIGTPTWYIYKGQFYTKFPFTYFGQSFIAFVEVSKKGEIINYAVYSGLYN